MSSLIQNEIIIIFSIILLLIIGYIVYKKYGKKKSSQKKDNWYNKDEEGVDKKTEEFYDDLSFMFPVLDSLDEPLELSTYLLIKNSNPTETQLKGEFENIRNFKNKEGYLSFDVDNTRVDLIKSSKEIVIDNDVHIVSHSSNILNLLFRTEDKGLSVVMHQEQGEYVVDEYKAVDPDNSDNILVTVLERKSKKHNRNRIKALKRSKFSEINNSILELERR